MQAVRIAGAAAQGSTAYLNLETGDCHGDDTSLRALISSGVSRVVLGLRNPLAHSRSVAVQVSATTGVPQWWTVTGMPWSRPASHHHLLKFGFAQELRRAGLAVEVLRESVFLGDPEREQATWQACLDVNEVGHLLVAHH